ncbi:MAG: MFS transporter, partial [Steroidobacteraceae bacterium]
AQTFWQLALARVGVGAGESGSIPTAQSLIADYFPPERRGSAFRVWYAAANPRTLLGYAPRESGRTATKSGADPVASAV